MSIALVGQKCGMTRVFTEDGVSIPVTVLQVLPNRVVQIKTLEKDGYRAVQVTTGSKKKSKLNKSQIGHFVKNGVEPGEGLWEFRVDEQDDLSQFTVGTELKLDRFSIGQLIDVTGVNKGKGFAGTVKRHHFSMQDATHGNSLSHRAPGSIGQRQSPGKVFKGKKMSGHLGNVRCTILSQKVVKLDLEKNLLLIQGAVPGAPGGRVIIRHAIKSPKKKGDK